MANSLTASIKELWSKEMQLKHEKNDVFRAIARMTEKEILKHGDTLNRPFRSAVTVQNYTRGTDFTVRDITTTNEQLSVDTAKVAPMYVDDLDALQHEYSVLQDFAQDAAVQLGNKIDSVVLAEYAQADSDVDAADFGGAGSDGITLTTANVKKAFFVAGRKLDALNVAADNRFAVVSPQFLQMLREYVSDRDTDWGDSVGNNGKVDNFAGFEVYLSNNITSTVRLTLGTTPSEGDAVVIDGITFTFNATPSGAGSVDIGSDAPTSIDNLVAAINDAGTVDTTYIQLSAANRDKTRDWTATDNTTSMDVQVRGVANLVVSETLTAAADVWTSARQIQHQLFGRKGATDIVIQKAPNVEIKDDPDRIGKNVVPWTLFGVKTFDYGDAMLVDMNIRQDSF